MERARSPSVCRHFRTMTSHDVDQDRLTRGGGEDCHHNAVIIVVVVYLDRQHSRATSWSVRQATGCLLEFPHRLESRMLARAREGLEVSERGREKARKREKENERERENTREGNSTLSLPGKTLSRARYLRPTPNSHSSSSTLYSSSVSRWPFLSSSSVFLSISPFSYAFLSQSFFVHLEAFEFLQIRWRRSYRQM